MVITVEDLPRWHVLHAGLAVPRGLSPAEREQPLRVIEYHVRVSCLDNEMPACGYSAAVLAARALVHTAAWPSVAFALRAAHNPDLFQASVEPKKPEPTPTPSVELKKPEPTPTPSVEPKKPEPTPTPSVETPALAQTGIAAGGALLTAGALIGAGLLIRSRKNH